MAAGVVLLFTERHGHFRLHEEITMSICTIMTSTTNICMTAQWSNRMRMNRQSTNIRTSPPSIIATPTEFGRSAA